MKAVILLAAATLFVGCSQMNKIKVTHYQSDHGQEMAILNEDGAMIASKVISECGYNTTERREHNTVEFKIDEDISTIIIKSPHYVRKTVTGVKDGMTIK